MLKSQQKRRPEASKLAFYQVYVKTSLFFIRFISFSSRQDKNVDSTSKQGTVIKKFTCQSNSCQKKVLLHLNGVIFLPETGGSGEESDVLSINADSDIDGPKEEPAAEQVAAQQPNPETSAGAQQAEAKRDIQSDIDESVSQILTLSSSSSKGGKEEPASVLPQTADACSPTSSHTPAACPPSVQQLELLELEMRARAIKALMKANSGKKPEPAKHS